MPADATPSKNRGVTSRRTTTDFDWSDLIAPPKTSEVDVCSWDQTTGSFSFDQRIFSRFEGGLYNKQIEQVSFFANRRRPP